MSEAKTAADYHRRQVDAEVAIQSVPGDGSDFSASRARQQAHTEAAYRADSAYAAASGKTVVYTPLGLPVFRDR